MSAQHRCPGRKRLQVAKRPIGLLSAGITLLYSWCWQQGIHGSGRDYRQDKQGQWLESLSPNMPVAACGGGGAAPAARRPSPHVAWTPPATEGDILISCVGGDAIREFQKRLLV